MDTRFESQFIMAYLEEKFQSAVVRISSHDRDHGTSGAFWVTSNATDSSMSEVMAIQVVNVVMPNTFYNVPAARSKLRAQVTHTNANTGVQTLSELEYVVAPGVYTISSLISHLESIVPEINFIEVDPATGKATIKWHSLTPFSGSIPNEQYTVHSGIDPTANPIAYILGFNQPNHATNVHSLEMHADSMPHMHAPDVVYIHCPQLSTASVFDFKEISSDVLVAVPMDVEFDGIKIHYAGDALSSITEYRAPRYLSELSFQLRDKFDQQLYPNGADWTLLIKIFYNLD
jgi:hypothetical protein